ncbi:MAG: hypothetical protein VX252_10195 [Myxococcota bacterium]|nr:hypothetical protein [Myxococcota bacterium]
MSNPLLNKAEIKADSIRLKASTFFHLDTFPDGQHSVSFLLLMLESSDKPELGPVFLLRCLECDELGRPSRLWLRASIEVRSGRSQQVHHYVECMNCGSHLRSRQPDHMERVAPDEWTRFVGEADAPAPQLPSGMERLA